MPDSPSRQDVFDVERIRRLVELMNEHSLSQMDIRDGEARIQLRRGGDPIITAPAVAAPLHAPVPPPSAARSAAPAGEKPADDPHILLIKSPMVGTFYTAPDPDSPTFVKVGDVVGPETVICIVEAMKVFNQIPAETSGRIVAVLCENGEPVEFGKPLFKVDTRG